MYKRLLLVARVWLELLQYDFVMKMRGFAAINRWARRRPRCRGGGASEELESAILRAISWAGSFYWKPIHCLQRSVVTARVMSYYGIPADIVIGYRPAPFFSHAWVEVNGRVANDLNGYRQKLRILERM